MSELRPSTGLALSQTYYMRQFYSQNKTAITSASRKKYDTTELTYEDVKALRKAAKKLQTFDYEKEPTKDDNNEASLTNAIQTYVSIYNNTLETGGKSTDSDIKRYVSQLKKYTKEHKSDLANMGIDINADGSLNAKKSMITSVKVDKLKNAFSKQSGYMTQVQRVARRFEYKTDELMYTQLTGNGGNVSTLL